MPRLFIGLPVPDAYREIVAATTAALAGCLESTVRWVPPQNVHLTLKFLGNVEEKRIPELTQALRAVDYLSFTMQAQGLHCFPHCGKPRVIWAGLKQGAEQSEALSQEVNESLAPLGFEPDTKPFQPHYTLGRVKKLAKEEIPPCLARAVTEWPAFTADRFVLWQSQTLPDGAVYTELESFPLK